MRAAGCVALCLDPEHLEDPEDPASNYGRLPSRVKHNDFSTFSQKMGRRNSILDVQSRIQRISSVGIQPQGSRPCNLMFVLHALEPKCGCFNKQQKRQQNRNQTNSKHTTEAISNNNNTCQNSKSMRNSNNDNNNNKNVPHVTVPAGPMGPPVAR